MKASALERYQARTALWFVAPALILFGVFFVVPVLAGLLLSLTDFDLYAIGTPSTARFVGLGNYTQTFRDPNFWNALRNTLYFVFAGAPLAVLTSLAAALLLCAPGVRLRGLFRTVYFAPVVTTLVAVAIVWRYLYHRSTGS
jgi:multiple sugar transport system permease protein